MFWGDVGPRLGYPDKSKAGLSTLAPPTFGAIIVCWGARPVHCRVLSGIPGLCQLHARSITPAVTTKHGPDIPWGRTPRSVENLRSKGKPHPPLCPTSGSGRSLGPPLACEFLECSRWLHPFCLGCGEAQSSLLHACPAFHELGPHLAFPSLSSCHVPIC